MENVAKTQSVKLKICGITRASNMLEIAELKPDYLGFIFYPPSPRDVTENIQNLPLDKLPQGILKVAVTVNKPLEEAIELVSTFKFDLVQLHGQETPQYCEEMQKHIAVIKAFSVKDSLPANLEEYEHCCNYFLFDTKADKPGGTGISFDHTILEQYKGKIPFFLGGGIGPNYFDSEKQFNHPMLEVLDINSRFETEPGWKDVETVKAFIIKKNSKI